MTEAASGTADQWTSAAAFDQEVLENLQKQLDERIASNPDDPNLFLGQQGLAASLAARGDWERAEGLLRSALEGQKRVLGAEHPDALNTAANLAAALLARGDAPAAEEMQREVLRVLERDRGVGSPEALMAQGNLLETLRSRGDEDGEERLLRAVAAGLEAAAGPDSPDAWTAKTNLARALALRGEEADAEDLEREVLASQQRVLGADDPETVMTKTYLMQILKSRGSVEEAEKIQSEILASHETNLCTAAVSGAEHGAPDGTKLRVVVAGGGIGGLCAALVLKNNGFDVQVFEKARAYKPFGGPIQIASNALETFQRIDEGVYEDIMTESTMIGDRMNGLKDGVSNKWFATFDLYSPAKANNQEASVVIDRPKLQEILLKRVGDCVEVGAEVSGYEKREDGGVTALLTDGSRYEADLLIGADGIWSKVRAAMDPNPKDPVWSGYTCFAGIANCVPDDIKDVGYKVFLGSKKYFVSVDVGQGRIQWYAFLNIPPKSLSLSAEEQLGWLKESQFADWSEEVHQLIDATSAEEVEQRDLFDRTPELKWADQTVCLLGDAAHPMMPNLGQGGGMAIEDALVLGQELRRISNTRFVPFALRKYNQNRAIRAAAVQGMSRLSSAILFQYEPPTEVDFSEWPPRLRNVGPRSFITRACQGFLQKVAFPLQFEYLYSFPGKSLDPEVFAEEMPGDFQASNPSREGPQSRGVVERDFQSLLKKEIPFREWIQTYW